MAQQAHESPVLDLLAKMTMESIEASTLDPKTLMLVRIAGLVAVDAPPASYLLNIGSAGDRRRRRGRSGCADRRAVVGTARIASSAMEIGYGRSASRSTSPSSRRPKHTGHKPPGSRRRSWSLKGVGWTTASQGQTRSTSSGDWWSYQGGTGLARRPRRHAPGPARAAVVPGLLCREPQLRVRSNHLLNAVGSARRARGHRPLQLLRKQQQEPLRRASDLPPEPNRLHRKSRPGHLRQRLCKQAGGDDHGAHQRPRLGDRNRPDLPGRLRPQPGGSRSGRLPTKRSSRSSSSSSRALSRSPSSPAARSAIPVGSSLCPSGF